MGLGISPFGIMRSNFALGSRSISTPTLSRGNVSIEFSVTENSVDSNWSLVSKDQMQVVGEFSMIPLNRDRFLLHCQFWMFSPEFLFR